MTRSPSAANRDGRTVRTVNRLIAFTGRPYRSRSNVPPRSIGTAARPRSWERLQFSVDALPGRSPGISRRAPSPDTFVSDEHKQAPRYPCEDAGRPSGPPESGRARNTDAAHRNHGNHGNHCLRRVCNSNKSNCNRNGQGRDAAQRAHPDRERHARHRLRPLPGQVGRRRTAHRRRDRLPRRSRRARA